MAAVFNHTMEQGAPFEWSILWKDNLGVSMLQSGDSAAMDIRLTKSQTGTLVLDCGSYLTVTAASALIALSIPATITAGLSFDKAYYDIEVTRSGSVIARVAQGEITLDTGVTA